MKYILTFVWLFALVTMLNYVVSSVAGVGFDFTTGAIIAVIFYVLFIIIQALIPNEPVAHDHH
ncbi:YjzD family protein [Paenisporosarcina cavernae]|uniref:DUF2929 family protein n=1 Tax=Paenisporosarcina cavernae TaxID=2320858 RepID=A0A385YQI8_9BACL|nr:YjzD family protein [Paenisporosarcina cavernae]AYC29005.1 DUF2929 family protein [Paenisporosarcina cavernae]